MSEGWPDFWIRGKKIDLIDLINTVNLIKTIQQIDNISNLGTLDTINTVGTIQKINPQTINSTEYNTVIDLIKQINTIDTVTNLGTLDTLNTIGTIQKINPTETENAVIDRIAKIDNVTNLGTLDTLNTIGTIQKINPQNTDNVVIDRLKLINTIETVNTLDTINTIGTVNTIDTINKIRDVTISEERRRDAIKNGFFNQALTGWYVDYVEIQDTNDPYFTHGYDAVLTSVDSNLIQYLIPFMRKDEVYSLQIRCKGAAAGDLQIMFINPSGGSYASPISITDSYKTYTVDIPYDVVACIWVMPADASIVPCRIKFISAPLKTKVYQAEKDRTITNFPSEYPLPSSQVTDLKNVTVNREGTYTPFSVEFTASGTQTIYTPSSGKKAQVLGWSLYNKDDVRIEVRYDTSGNVIAALTTSGASAMNLIGLNPPTGDVDEAIEVAAWGATMVKGWLCIREV